MGRPKDIQETIDGLACAVEAMNGESEWRMFMNYVCDLELAASGLTFDRLRKVNTFRCRQVWHELEEWSPTDWACALAGETGELCNFVKKLRRLDSSGVCDQVHEAFAPSDGADTCDNCGAPIWKHQGPSRSALRDEIAKEAGDVVAYLDLLCARLGIDLGESVKAKFNDVSARVGSEARL